MEKYLYLILNILATSLPLIRSFSERTYLLLFRKESYSPKQFQRSKVYNL
ncbi:hypothetical protein A33Q_2563 [Indibacter alkaliphilus LW1]|uniref:Uncharacterized protein n=1 Tax=Indibacter alkaliphilus (strain CCUG 57479 / KCTC 22604 / LW1) TaxID=1189612 RepID=S2DFY7_INDAL|nr:hypothetical protein A33Q_2563 [Indibacter alkaliphilus LW1]